MIRKSPDFSEVIKYFSDLKRKYAYHQIDRLKVAFYDSEKIEVTIRKVNPPGPDVAMITLIGYEKYGEFGRWDARGVFKMMDEEVIKKISIPSPV